MHELIDHLESVVAFLSWKCECDPFNPVLRLERDAANYKLNRLKDKSDAI